MAWLGLAWLGLAWLGLARETVIYSFNIGIQQKIHLQEYSSKHQESRSNIKKGQYVPYTLRRTASP